MLTSGAVYGAAAGSRWLASTPQAPRALTGVGDHAQVKALATEVPLKGLQHVKRVRRLSNAKAGEPGGPRLQILLCRAAPEVSPTYETAVPLQNGADVAVDAAPGSWAEQLRCDHGRSWV